MLRCRYGFALGQGHWLENAALNVGKGQMGAEVVAVWPNGDRCRFRQRQRKLREQGEKHNQEMSSYEKIRHKLPMPGVRRRYKRLCVCLCGIVDSAVDNLRFILFH